MSANYITIPGGTTHDIVITAENLISANNEIRLVCKTADGPVIINLPSIASLKYGLGVKFIIDDADDNAATNNITVNAAVDNTVNNAASYVVSTSGAKLQIFVASKVEYGVSILGVSAPQYISNAPVGENYPTGGTQTFNLPITKNGNYLVTVHGTLRNDEIVESGGVHSTIDITGSNGPRQYLSKIPATGGQTLIYNQRLVTITDYNTQVIDCNISLPGGTSWEIQNLIVSALIL